MIAWMVTIITLILLFFLVWRMISPWFRECCERPKYLFLEGLGVRSANPSHTVNPVVSEEKIDESAHS